MRSGQGGPLRLRSKGASRLIVRATTTSTEEVAVRRLLWAEEVAVLLGVPVKTLYQWRYKGVGPAGMRVGRHLRYRAVDVEAWIDGRAARERAPR